MSYVLSRIATNNPDINGRKLYYTSIGMWTLDPAHAKVFNSAADLVRTVTDGVSYTLEQVPE